MKNIVFICTFLLSFINQSFSQSVDIKNDSLIYMCILNQPGYNSHKIHNTPICDTAYLETLKKVDFKKTDLNKWVGGKSIAIGWQAFFNQINVDALKEYKLTIRTIGGHPFIIRDYGHPFLSLSPVIYSSDKSLAICSVRDYSGYEASGEEVYLLQFKDNRWQMVRFLLVSIS
ncbi:MAG: hypothetical protein JWR38_5727 [Mucilaginibacter sp.]|nr:hypothetical protein [Mucilaginibacter sp.]